MSPEGALPAAEADVVVPVFGALRHVRACLEELKRWTDDVDHRLVVVDDASDAYTHAVLRKLVARGWGSRGTILTNDRNLGFLQSANRGMQAGTSPRVVLLNSDTLPTPGWLSGLVRCLDSASDAGVVCPTSNYSNVTRIDVPYGVDHVRMAEAVRRVSPHNYPELGLASGFCLMMRRTMLTEVDYFDELFGRGYFEETDLCLRAQAVGWRVLADDATYVHHHGWASFGAGGYGALMEANRERFMQRWGDADRQLANQIRTRRPFRELQRRVWVALKGQAQVEPRRQLHDHRSRRTAERARLGELSVASHHGPPASSLYSLDEWAALIARRPAPLSDAHDILVLTDDLVVTPYTTDVLQVVDRLARLGLRVSLATAGSYDGALYSDPCRLRPFVLEGPEETAATMPPHRLVLATSAPTVYYAALLAIRDGSRLATWFEPQATSLHLGWPDEGWATVFAPQLADAHLGPYVPEPLPRGSARHEVPVGVDTDLYRPPPSGFEERQGVLIPHDAHAGPAATALVSEAVDLLRRQDLPVRIYGHSLPGDDTTPVVAWAPQEEEQRLLTAHAALVEIAPVPGLERLRLRCAATATPVVAAGPVGRACQLRPGEEIAVAPRGDVQRAVQLTLSAVQDPRAREDRITAALSRARDHDLSREVDALANAYRLIMQSDDEMSAESQTSETRERT